MKKQCGNCEFWDRENKYRTLLMQREWRAACLKTIDSSGNNRKQFMYKTEGQDCPVYKEKS